MEPKIYYRPYKNPTLEPIPSLLDQINVLSLYFSKIHLSCILTSVYV
jgi:hypothetical protein